MRAGVVDPPDAHRKDRRFRTTGRGIAAAAVVLLIAGACIRLGFWQLDRQDEKDRYNATLTAALEQPPLELGGSELDRVLADPEAFLFRRVTVTGSFENGRAVVVRGRSLGGSPGVNLVTPLAVDRDSTVVLVNRGWLPAADGSKVDPRPFSVPGTRVIHGILQPLGAGGETHEVRLDVGGEGVRTVQRPDLTLLTGPGGDVRAFPLLVQQLPTDGEDASTAPIALPIPEIDPGPHLGYAVQWFSFAAIALLGFGLMLHLSRRNGGASRGV
jgi:surfeit locus 1 family protein